jgi:hypothetical protein
MAGNRRTLLVSSPILIAFMLAVLPFLGAQADRRPEAALPRSRSAASVAVTQVAPDPAPRYGLWVAQNYPNPFGAATDFSWSLPGASDVSLRVYDVQGTEVATVVAGRMEAGLHRMSWKGTDARGWPLASGVYVYQFVAGSFVRTKKLLISR